MKIAIIGAGKIGSSIAAELSGENHDIVLIDPDREVVERLTNELDVLGVCGNGMIEADQREAGIPRSDIVLAVTRSDETNIVCCLIAKALGAAHTVARVRDPELSVQSRFMRDKLGIDLLVNPEAEAAAEIARHLRYPNAEHVDCFGRGKADLVAVRIPAKSPVAGVPLRDFGKALKLKVLACAIEREGEVVIPDGGTTLTAGDVVYFTGTYQSIDALFRRLGLTSAPVRSMLVVGGGRITHYLARTLLDSGMRVKIVERDRDKCERLAEALPKATVICGDGADKKLLVEEGIDLVNSFVSLTGNDEFNIILSLYAKTHGVEKVVTKVNSESFTELLGTLDLGTIISPRAVTGEQTAKFARSVQVPEGGSGISALYKIIGDKAEAVEFRVDDNEKFAGRNLRDITLKPGVILACVTRGKEIFIPDGDSTVEEGDLVVVISAAHKFTRLDEILA